MQAGSAPGGRRSQKALNVEGEGHACTMGRARKLGGEGVAHSSFRTMRVCETTLLQTNDREQRALDSNFPTQRTLLKRTILQEFEAPSLCLRPGCGWVSRTLEWPYVSRWFGWVWMAALTARGCTAARHGRVFSPGRELP